MRIVQHCTSFSYSLFPPHPLLAAPPERLMLPAPRISGLLAAPKLTIIVEKYDPLEDVLREYGWKTVEEMDEELYAEMKSPLTRAIYDEIKAFNRRREQ